MKYSHLTYDNVSIIEEIPERHRKIINNSKEGRDFINQEMQEPLKSEILNVWGKYPTVGEVDEVYQGQALISFVYDDGYRNNYTKARPLHLQYNIPGTFYLTTDWMKNDNRYSPVMTKEDAKQMLREGFEIGSHTVSHGIDEERYSEEYPDGKKLVNMTEGEIIFELNQSKFQLNRLGIPVSGLAMPWGSHANNRDLYKICYKYARSTHSDFGSIEDIWDIPVTFTARYNNNAEDLKQIIDEAIADNKWAIILMHHVIEQGDIDVEQNSNYYWYVNQLENVFQYINSKSSDLLPVDMRQAIAFIKNK